MPSSPTPSRSRADRSARSGRGGYTYLEMVAAVGIIGILVSIAWCTYDLLAPIIKVKEAEILVREMARYASISDFEENIECSWSPEATIGKTKRALPSLAIGAYRLEPDGDVRCSYCLDVHLDRDGVNTWAVAICDVDGNGKARIYLAPAFTGVPKPGTVDPIAGLYGAERSLTAASSDAPSGSEGAGAPARPSAPGDATSSASYSLPNAKEVDNLIESTSSAPVLASALSSSFL